MTAKVMVPPQIGLTEIKALEHAAEFLKTLAHPHRLRILQMLVRGRYTVGELATACGIPSHMASEHLRHMQWCGLLTHKKEGRRNYYLIADPHLSDMIDCIETRFGAMKTVDFPLPCTKAQA